jgi:hypothetical protein
MGFGKKIFLSYFLILGLVMGEMMLMEKNTEHSTYFRMGELWHFSNDVVKYEVKPEFYFCGEFCPVKIIPGPLQIEKKSFIKIKAK